MKLLCSLKPAAGHNQELFEFSPSSHTVYLNSVHLLTLSVWIQSIFSHCLFEFSPSSHTVYLNSVHLLTLSIWIQPIFSHCLFEFSPSSHTLYLVSVSVNLGGTRWRSWLGHCRFPMMLLGFFIDVILSAKPVVPAGTLPFLTQVAWYGRGNFSSLSHFSIPRYFWPTRSPHLLLWSCWKLVFFGHVQQF